MNIAIMGAGAVGGYFGGVLARYGEDVSLIARGAHADALEHNGLQIDSHWGRFTVRPPVLRDPADAGTADLVLYCVKLYSNAEVLPRIRPMVGPQTSILTLQNGIASGEVIAACYGRERVLPGATYVEAAVTAPGRVRQAGPVARIEFGETDGSRSARVERIADVLDKPGIQVQLSADIRAALWTKLVSIGALGTVVTAARASLVEVLAAPEGEHTIRAVMEEIVAVGEALDVTFPAGVVDAMLRDARERASEFGASLQRDFEQGKPLELDGLLGTVVRLGRTHAVPVPVSAALVTVLHKFKDGAAAATSGTG